MAHRCRSCRGIHYTNDAPVLYPTPDTLALFDPLILPLFEAAREFEKAAKEGDSVGSPVEFVEWLSVDVKHAAGPARHSRVPR